MKQTIKLSEQELKGIIRESIMDMLPEKQAQPKFKQGDMVAVNYNAGDKGFGPDGQPAIVGNVEWCEPENEWKYFCIHPRLPRRGWFSERDLKPLNRNLNEVVDKVVNFIKSISPTGIYSETSFKPPIKDRMADFEAAKTLTFDKFLSLYKERTDDECNSFSGVVQFKLDYKGKKERYVNEFVGSINPTYFSFKHMDLFLAVRRRAEEILGEVLQKYKDIPPSTWIVRPLTNNFAQYYNASRNDVVRNDIKNIMNINPSES